MCCWDSLARSIPVVHMDLPPQPKQENPGLMWKNPHATWLPAQPPGTMTLPSTPFFEVSVPFALFRAYFRTGHSAFWGLPLSLPELRSLWYMLPKCQLLSFTYQNTSWYSRPGCLCQSFIPVWSAFWCSNQVPPGEMGCFNKGLFHRLSISCAHREKEMHT